MSPPKAAVKPGESCPADCPRRPVRLIVAGVREPGKVFLAQRTTLLSGARRLASKLFLRRVHVGRAAVDRRKQVKLTQLALAWLKKKNLLGHPARFDVIAIRWDANKTPIISHYKNAFQAADLGQIY